MNAHVTSPSLKDFVRYQAGSEVKVLPWLCPFSANSTVVLLNRELQALLPWDSCRRLFCAHLGVASCRAFLYLSGVWCWELRHRNWLGLSARDRAPCVTAYGTSSSAWQQKCLSLRDVVKSCDTKFLHGVPSSVQTLHCTQQQGHVPFQPKPGCLCGGHAGVEAAWGGWTPW